MIRRTIAGLMLGPSLLVGSLTWAGFLALRTVFDADRSRDIAEELLDNDEVRSQLTENLGTAIEAAVPAEIPLSSQQVEQVAAAVLVDPAVEDVILTAFSRAHASFLGEGSAPQTLDLTAAADALRIAVIEVEPAFESVFPQSPVLRVTLPTDRIPNAGPFRSVVQTAVPILAVAAIAGGLLALLTTSDRASVLTKAGIWALSTTAFYLLLGFGVPWGMRRFAPEQVEVLAALVTALLRTTLVPSIVLALCGVGLIGAAIMWPDGEPAPGRGRSEPRREPATSAARRPVWPGPVPQPLVYPEPEFDQRGTVRSASSGDPPSRPSPAASPPDRPPPRPPPAASESDRPPSRPPPAASRPDRPPPLPTVASTSPRPPSPSEGESLERPGTRPTRPADPSVGSSGRLPTKELDDRPSKWMPPCWVEGHGWVMDPDDPTPPPHNARYVDGLGYVVPGPPPR